MSEEKDLSEDIVLRNMQSVEDDYERTKATLYKLLEDGQLALELSYRVAEDTEHPRAIEVYSTLLKNVADISDKLMELNRKHKDYFDRKSHREAPATTTNNNLFVGTTTDLQHMLAKIQAGEPIDITPNDEH